ncbi:exonuclease domain-containing protein [Tenacibaculum maritimum]|uniref:DNA polymerase III, epsilon subunit n=2 Tax=Tenacibaculum maritimum TaxID=107401 RepID=A0A2H1E9H8_9FLAO|nr:exonuclease domain-containing protein [Tenacibaculum maritimum]MCD9562627.1 ribonuclease H-like domain-containing protein [Tenacibaculum maritimum]MCD9565957.1 ribonuclease H-like domain-containing protein [Tenacibaculum maritimum]MCD9578781.1 ribonuclease H-like domain-containing protein [Tenacibaculum maritimum]MCD9585808.1 ribonuclease H-like domain-containing protein [Tenacibaculum maritimum]MCD9611749.1 ribonuclease H-like domain-containing protein [Tenacibaculum maritimum]
MYVILDIETTGGKYNEEGITEIAIYKFDGHTVVDQFISLVNPEREIQEFVVKLTGINSKMLRNAPKFYEIAKRIVEITENCILVAHNASFDYRILRTEFKRLGFEFQRNTLCTVELSKKLIPEAPSHSLGKLSRFLGIPVSDRHRANGDALATVKLFKLLLEKDTEKEILKNAVKYADKRNTKNKLNALLDKAPDVMGVFYLHNAQGNVIFVGRGANIKKEINNVFIKTSKRSKKLQDKVISFTYEETGNELLTRLKYYSELETLNPKYNIRKKRKTMNLTPFNHTNMILVDKGRNVEEHSVILIENNEIIGYGFTNLAHQENKIEILKSILTPIPNKMLAKTIIKNYLQRKKVQKIIRL